MIPYAHMPNDEQGRPVVPVSLMYPVVLTRAREFAYAAQTVRKEAGLTQAEVAAKAGVSRTWLSRFETGKRSVEFQSVVRVFTALGCAFRVVPQPASPEGIDVEAVAREARARRSSWAADG